MSDVSSSKHEEIRGQLQAIGDRRREHKRLRAEADHLAREWIPKAKAAGLSITEIAEQTDFTRKAIYDLLTQNR